MSKRIAIKPKASEDIDQHVDYLMARNEEAALRLFDAIRATAAQIAVMPGAGQLYECSDPKLRGLRKRAVKGFKNYLIFYMVRDTEVSIIRVLYASQDISSILD